MFRKPLNAAILAFVLIVAAGAAVFFGANVFPTSAVTIREKGQFLGSTIGVLALAVAIGVYFAVKRRSKGAGP